MTAPSDLSDAQSWRSSTISKCTSFNLITPTKSEPFPPDGVLQLMGQWSRIDIADALELLSPDFSNEEVRAHAVAVLDRAPDEELLYYLLQLIQALRYESSDDR